MHDSSAAVGSMACSVAWAAHWTGYSMECRRCQSLGRHYCLAACPAQMPCFSRPLVGLPRPHSVIIFEGVCLPGYRPRQFRGAFMMSRPVVNAMTRAILTAALKRRLACSLPPMLGGRHINEDQDNTGGLGGFTRRGCSLPATTVGDSTLVFAIRRQAMYCWTGLCPTRCHH